MRKSYLVLGSALVVAAIAAGSVHGQTASNGAILADAGGAPGYQHSIERSRFVTGERADPSQAPAMEFGFAKIAGSQGVFATNLRNGLVIALQDGGTDKDQAPMAKESAESRKLMEPDEHNKAVMAYFEGAGIPRDQIGGIHANTYLSANGTAENPHLSPPKVDGYASILERRIGDRFAVPESVAWARLADERNVMTEWVYWPAIPAKAIDDARRLAALTTGERKNVYFDKLPVGLREGAVVIHHSLGTDEGPFEVVATFDVMEVKRATKPSADGKSEGMELTSMAVRHFDVDGRERRLSYERRNAGPSDERPVEPASAQ